MHICVQHYRRANGGQNIYIYGKHTIGGKVYIYIGIYVYIGDIANWWFNYVPPLKPPIAIIYVDLMAYHNLIYCYIASVVIAMYKGLSTPNL